MARIVVGVTGASGIVLAFRTIQALAEAKFSVELVMSQHAVYTASLEMGKEYASAQKLVQHLPKALQKSVTIHSIHDVGSSIASGSYVTEGMVIVPCSMSTLAAISCGLSDNCLKRAADVTIKERRPLIIVPRESPLSEIHLENMLRISKRGAIILPPVPAWYNEPKGMEDVENFIVGKILDSFKIENSLYKRWDGSC
jgi:4-hydroxy-3-polyprenylbenzoate decarboxylase